MTDSENLDRAVALIRNGKPVPAGVRVSAMRAARARGVPVPSAELLAAQAGGRWQDHDTARRRPGQRPRS